MLVTVVCVWLGWHSQIVRQRKELLREHNVIHTTDRPFIEEDMENPWQQLELPFIRRWMGDELVSVIWVPRFPTEHDKARVKSLFPEARLEGPWPYPIVKGTE